jgi:pectate lyase
MWEVDPEVTQRYIEAFWGAHIVDWSNLCMNRHGRFDRRNRQLWANEFKGGPVFFTCDGLTFVSTGSDLYCAAAMLAHLSGRNEPMVWAKRMAERYVETRNPRTGLPGYQYTRYDSGDRAFKQFGPEWGDRILEGTLLVPDLSVRQFADASAAQLLLGELLGTQGRDFTRWGLEDLSAYARHAYNPDDNTFAAMITDGTRLSPEDVKRKGYFGPAGSDRFQPLRAGPDLLRAYALAYRVSGDSAHWQTARSIARGNDLGDIGVTPGDSAKVNLDTSCAEPNALLAMLEIHARHKASEYLSLALRIGANILEHRFRKGFFLERSTSRHAKFDSMAPLALLRLAATERNQSDRVPTIWPGKSYFHCDYEGEGRTYDNSVIYAR